MPPGPPGPSGPSGPPPPRGPRESDRDRDRDDRKRDPRVDRRIRVPEVLVIDANGEKLGVMATHEALQRAQEQGLNLVEVAPNSRPPVCRILDYGKYKYEQKQDAKRKKRNQIVVEIKEVKFRPKIDKHDFEFKLRHMERFLGDGDKVKCTIMFRGRELAHTEIGEIVLKRVLQELGDRVIVESPARQEGRNLQMLLAPKPGAWPKKTKEGQDGAEVDEGSSGGDEAEDGDHGEA